METYYFQHKFTMNEMVIQPVHIRVEQLRLLIPSHRHSHTSYEIHYTAKGRGSVKVEGQSFLVQENTLYVTGPDISHEQVSDPDDPIIEFCLYLNCKKMKNARAGNSVIQTFLDTKFWIGQDEEQVFEEMKKLILEYREKSYAYEEMGETILRRIILLMVKSYQKDIPLIFKGKKKVQASNAEHYPLVEDAFFYDYKTLCLSELSELLHLSERQTQRFLKEHYGKTFSQKLLEARMSAALPMLLNTDFTIEKIAEEVGYSTGEHFSTAFRRFYHKPPSIYRKTYHREEKRILPEMY